MQLCTMYFTADIRTLNASIISCFSFTTPDVAQDQIINKKGKFPLQEFNTREVISFYYVHTRIDGLADIFYYRSIKKFMDNFSGIFYYEMKCDVFALKNSFCKN